MKKLLMLGMLLNSFLLASWTIEPILDKLGKPYENWYVMECKDKTGKYHIEMNSVAFSTFAILKSHPSNEKHITKDIMIEFKIDKNKVIKNLGININNEFIMVSGLNHDKNIKSKLIPSFVQLINEMKDGKELEISVKIDGLDELLVFPLDNFKEVLEEAKIELN